MNQLEALTTLVDAARQMPENKHLNRAIKVVEKKIEHMRVKRLQRHPQLPPINQRPDEKCVCGGPVRGDIDGEGRCCATCCFHPLGCRCQFGDPADTVNTAHE
jgi:hypothetical protein